MRKIQIAISSDLCIRLTWNLTGSCSQQQRLRVWSRMMVKQFQDGGRPPFWKSIYCHISVKNHPIFMKFCTQQQILNWLNVTWSKNEKVALDRLRVRQNVFLVITITGTQEIKGTSYVMVLGDWNAVVGKSLEDDSVGKFGLGSRNDRGQKLVEFCERNWMMITNTWFKHEKQWRYT